MRLTFEQHAGPHSTRVIIVCSFSRVDESSPTFSNFLFLCLSIAKCTEILDFRWRSKTILHHLQYSSCSSPDLKGVFGKLSVRIRCRHLNTMF
ncbi:hypothetical protein PoB_004236900 [Plakobranchus ocellatus]|uniref:Uncharacterized protein n=1 Tax=Plakobranchus ocellatus TaxID=259542 RepID=A0AAV4BAY6_9GAST|nr:hypothetical protein PoB_004236900 [Plakobranchus ocellatus]